MERPWIPVIVGLLAFATAPLRAEAGDHGFRIRGGQLAERQGRPLMPWRPEGRRGGYQEPAYARGYSDGYMRGLDAGRNRERYDLAGNRSYRSGDQGYDRRYGSRAAYKNNYRAGFRQGYEEGYRDGGRGRSRSR